MYSHKVIYFNCFVRRLNCSACSFFQSAAARSTGLILLIKFLIP